MKRAAHGKEYAIQTALIVYLRDRGWLVERLIGNQWQVGIPDLFAFHRKWGFRWIDVKCEGRYSFTKAQKIKWPVWDAAGLGIWILTGASQEQYDRLFAPPNMKDYWKDSWALPTQAEIDQLLDEVTLD